MIKCPKCGHDAEMHWYPECPGVPDYLGQESYGTTACRDCLPRQLYPHKDGRIDGGMCCWTRDAILLEVRDVYAPRLAEALREGLASRPEEDFALPDLRQRHSTEEQLDRVRRLAQVWRQDDSRAWVASMGEWLEDVLEGRIDVEDPDDA